MMRNIDFTKPPITKKELDEKINKLNISFDNSKAKVDYNFKNRDSVFYMKGKQIDIKDIDFFNHLSSGVGKTSSLEELAKNVDYSP